MCIRDSSQAVLIVEQGLNASLDRSAGGALAATLTDLYDYICLLYTSDAADERSSVDLGGRRIIKKKNST